MDDIKDTGHELRPLNSMNNLGSWLTLKSPGHEIRVVDAIHRSGLSIT